MENIILYTFVLAIGTFISFGCVRNANIGFLKFIGGWTLAWVVFIGAHPTRVTVLILLGLLGYGIAFAYAEFVASEAQEDTNNS